MASNVAAFEVRLSKAEHLLLDASEGTVRCAHYSSSRGRRTAKAGTLEDVLEKLFGAPDELHCADTLGWYVREHTTDGPDLP